MRQSYVTLSISGALLFLIINSAASAQEDATTPREQHPQFDETELVHRILEQVQATREEIVSAEIQYRWHLSSYLNPRNTSERVAAAIADADLVSDPENLETLIEELVPQFELNGPVWESRDFVMLGDKRRADTSRGTIQLVDADHEMTYHLFNEQLSVSSRGGSSVHRTRIEDFRSFPRADFGASDFLIEDRADGTVVLALIPGLAESQNSDVLARYSIDEMTGVMTHEVSFARGQPLREIWQHALTEYPGGVTMPSLRIDAYYQNGRLKTLTAWSIENATINGPVDEDRFVMSVPEQTVLVDTRLPKKSVWKVKKPVDDVRSILTPITAAGTPVSGQSGTNWRILLLLNGLVFFVLAAWLWKKGSPSSSTSIANSRD